MYCYSTPNILDNYVHLQHFQLAFFSVYCSHIVYHIVTVFVGRTPTQKLEGTLDRYQPLLFLLCPFPVSRYFSITVSSVPFPSPVFSPLKSNWQVSGSTISSPRCPAKMAASCEVGGDRITVGCTCDYIVYLSFALGPK